MNISKSLMLMATAALMSFGLAGCDVDVKDSGELPEVDVREGRAPDVDVETPDVDVRTEPREVDVPTDIDVETEPREVEVPTIDVEPADEN